MIEAPMLRFCSYAFDKAKAASKYRVLLDDDRTFADDEKDTDLFERIWAKQLPGVLNHGNRGYKRLLERGTKFNRPTAVEKAARLSCHQAISCCRVREGLVLWETEHLEM